MKEIYLIRHGETEYNVKGIATGKADISINDSGMRQAEKTGDYLKKYDTPKFDCILCSTLKRTKETAEIIAKKIGYKKKICAYSELVEYGKGKLEGADKNSQWSIDFDRDERDYDKKYEKDPIGWFKNREKHENQISKKYKQESPKGYINRLDQIINFIENSTCKKIIVITHGRTVNSLVKLIFGLPLVPFGRGKNKMGNCSITYMTYDKGEWTLIVPVSTSHLDESVIINDIRGI